MLVSDAIGAKPVTKRIWVPDCSASARCTASAPMGRHRGWPVSRGRNGFGKITSAVKYLEDAGFGFGKEGRGPGEFYEFDQVSARTPDPPAVNTRSPA